MDILYMTSRVHPINNAGPWGTESANNCFHAYKYVSFEYIESE